MLLASTESLDFLEGGKEEPRALGFPQLCKVKLAVEIIAIFEYISIGLYALGGILWTIYGQTYGLACTGKHCVVLYSLRNPHMDKRL